MQSLHRFYLLKVIDVSQTGICFSIICSFKYGGNGKKMGSTRLVILVQVKFQNKGIEFLKSTNNL